MLNKIDIIDGAFKLLRISGITVNATPGEVSDALQTLDDYCAELKPFLDLGYIQPSDYGQSDPNDYSGLLPSMAGPLKKIMTIQLAPFFAKQIPRELAIIADNGMRSLEQLLVNVADTQNPATLPIGSGNEWDYRSNKFYTEPNNDDGAINYYSNEVFGISTDWSPWLAQSGDHTLVSVVYDNDSEIVVSNEAIVDNTSSATISFTTEGQFQMCIVATNSNGDVKNERIVYNSVDCKKVTPYFP
jgi:hypothetical protein